MTFSPPALARCSEETVIVRMKPPVSIFAVVASKGNLRSRCLSSVVDEGSIHL
jgi:hypothetical protein